jgi:hypothetical protein
MSNNILIIPDLHQRYGWVVPCLNALKGTYDKVVFLGDYLDDFNDHPEEVSETANLVKYLLHTKDFGKITMLHGNHDFAYRFWHYKFLQCSGNEQWKHGIVASILTENDWSKMKLFHYERDSSGREWYFSHGGLHTKFFAHPLNGITKQYVTEVCKKTVEDARMGVYNPVHQAGRARGNFGQTVGGILWLDWNEEFLPIENVNQIVGHTPRKQPEKYPPVHARYGSNKKIIQPILNSENWCFDTHSHHLCLWKDGVVSVIENEWYFNSIQPKNTSSSD